MDAMIDFRIDMIWSPGQNNDFFSLLSCLLRDPDSTLQNLIPISVILCVGRLTGLLYLSLCKCAKLLLQNLSDPLRKLLPLMRSYVVIYK